MRITVQCEQCKLEPCRSQLQLLEHELSQLSTSLLHQQSKSAAPLCYLLHLQIQIAVAIVLIAALAEQEYSYHR
jgi:hypothetical protein